MSRRLLKDLAFIADVLEGTMRVGGELAVGILAALLGVRVGRRSYRRSAPRPAVYHVHYHQRVTPTRRLAHATQ